ncbi:MAG: lysoplasmalogenase [Thermodesulfobacteriota bacterium]
MPIAILFSSLILLAALIACEKTDAPLLRLLVKSVLSALFLVAALLATRGFSLPFTLLFIGLCFCFAGDVLLAVPSKKAFLAGLVCFAFGHLFYAACFLILSGGNPAFLLGLAVCAVLGTLVLRQLRPFLGSMKGPVVFYVTVISLMMAAACSLLVLQSLSTQARAMAFGGALAFYFSDLFVARHRFVKKSFLNRLVGLPLYYSGQFLLAAFAANL